MLKLPQTTTQIGYKNILYCLGDMVLVVALALWRPRLELAATQISAETCRIGTEPLAARCLLKVVANIKTTEKIACLDGLG